jgi:hypothetical protein
VFWLAVGIIINKTDHRDNKIGHDIRGTDSLYDAYSDFPVGIHWNRKFWRVANLGERKVNSGMTLTLLSFKVAVPWQLPSVPGLKRT